MFPACLDRALRKPQPAERDYLAAQMMGSGLAIGQHARHVRSTHHRGLSGKLCNRLPVTNVGNTNICDMSGAGRRLVSALAFPFC